MPEYRYIGKPAARVDALEKVLGTARYIADLRVPGMLCSRALRSTLPHARIAQLDVSPALKVKGVLAAITCEDFVDHGRFGYPVEDMYMLAWQKVRYVGEAIAAIAAENEEVLEAGLQAIRLELEPLEGVFDPREALQPSAPLVGPHPWDSAGLPRGNLLNHYIVSQGDPDAVFAECAVTLDEEYSTAHQEHAYLETEGALAIPWPGNTGLTVHCPSQSPFANRGNLCRVLGLPVEDVRVIQPPVGGAFGGKDDQLYQTSGQVARLALLTGRPVRMTFSREESMIFSYKRNPVQIHVRLGANADGRLRASDVSLLVDSGAYSAITPFVAWRGTIHAMGPYRYEACHVTTDVAYTNNGYTGAFRGFGNTETTACIEQAVDELAAKLGFDPIDFRLRNCLRPFDVTPHGQPLGEDVALVECLEKARSLSNWDRRREEIARSQPTEYSPGDFRRGMGVACFFHGISLGAEGADSAGATLSINADDSITLTCGLTDYGTGSRTVYALIAAELLGLDPGRIQMLCPDTDTALDSGPTVASRATVVGGNAVRVAAARLNSLLNLAAADLFGCLEGQVSRDGELYIGPNEEPASYPRVAAHARKMGLTLSARGRWSVPEIHWDFDAGRGRPYFAYHFGAQVAEVLVDTGTGKVAVTGLWAAHNTGTVIFPQGILGQLYGGMALGVGYALMERVNFDQGFIQETNFDEYLIPTALDVPEISGAFVEKPFAAGPFGAKNIGEPGMVPTAPAILNAIAHAIGRRVRHLPANLERILLGHDLRKEGSNLACKLGLRAKVT
ncbi:MAG TPA: xanthine dehydrogenase family protein molybdopterin-binding subunit [Anaerolineaceae bacterium]|nr:xanthine dehydrogenase family protein molybdopterin-binding subunit [Anaerolineaceae bacterium]